jgi:hypothetical protein
MDPPFLTSALDGGQWSASCPGLITRRQIGPGTHRKGDWAGPRTGLDVVEKRKILSCLELNQGRPARSLSLYRPSRWCLLNLFFFLVAPTFESLLPLLEHRDEFPQFLDQGQSVGLLGRVISSSQGLYLYTHTHTEKRTHIHKH